MWIKSLLLLLSGAFPFLLSAQSAILGTPAGNEYAISICADNAGNTFIGGTSDNDALVVKQDGSQGITWSRRLSFSADPQHVSEISFIDIVGDTVFGCGYVRNGVTLTGYAYFKLNAQTGAPYWIKAEVPEDVYFSCMRYYDGRFMLVGGVFDTGNADKDGKVMTVSSQDGQILWQSGSIGLTFPGYGIDYLDDFIGASEIVNGQLFITGRSYVFGATDLNMRPLLVGVDITGNIFLTRYLMFDAAGIGTQQDRMYGQRVAFDGTDSLVVAFAGDDNCGTCDNFNSGLLKCDLQGNVGWERFYDIPGVTSEVARSINVTPTGYVLYGQVNTGLSNMRLFLIKTDKQGHYTDCALVGPVTGTYSVYAGLGNLAAGNSDYTNGLHYFAAVYAAPGGNDIRKLVVDDNLNDIMSCSVSTSPIVSETSFAPFSGPLDMQIALDVVTPLPASDVPGTLPETCAGLSVDFSQSPACTGVAITATPSGFGTPFYQWSNGQSGTTVNAATADTLFVAVTDIQNCCIVHDTVVPVLTAATPLSVSLGNDTAFCLAGGQVYTLVPTVQNAIGQLLFNWSDGSTAPQLDVTVAGTYWVTVADNCTAASDTVVLDIHPFPVMQLPAVLDTCFASGTGFSYTAQGTPGTWQWSSGSQTATEQIMAEGIYTVTLTNDCGSVSQDISVNRVSDISLVVPHDSLLFCSNGISAQDLGVETNYELDIYDAADSTLVPGEITHSGWYVLHAYNTCGSLTDSVFVNMQNEQFFYLPNTFTPNDDSFNERYGFVGESVVVDEVLIFNRWGQVVYEEKNGFSGWNGTYNGQRCPDGTYHVRLLYKNCFGKATQLTGFVTLLK